MARPRERRLRVSRRFAAGVVVLAKELREGDEFVTVVTRRAGVVLERRHDGVLVGLPNDVERRIHPRVRVEVA